MERTTTCLRRSLLSASQASPRHHTRNGEARLTAGHASSIDTGTPPKPAVRGAERTAAGIPADLPLVDCDVHAPMPTIEQLRPYLPAHWIEHFALTGYSGRTASVAMSYPPGASSTMRSGVESAPGLDAVELIRRDVLDAWGAEAAVINCVTGVEAIQHPDIAEAVASATNDWLVEEWLSRDPRLRASIVVPPQYMDAAVREIDRVGDHPGFVQILLPVRSTVPYGNRCFHPLFRSASSHELAIGLHFGGTPVGGIPTSVGWPSYYIEEYVGMAQVFQSQLMSLIFEGVFAEFPTARVAFVEGGFSWLPAWLWRLDQDWKNLRRETPWVQRPPSEYVRDHLRLTIQPNDVPADARDVALLLEQLPPGLLMFATDYPHRHYENAAEALPPGLDDGALRSLVADVPRAFYRLAGDV